MKGLKLAILCLSLLSQLSMAADQTVSSDISDLNDRITSLKGVSQSINDELSSQRAEIGQLKAEVKSANYENEKLRRQLLNEIKSVQRQNQAIIDTFVSGQALKKQTEDGSIMEIKPLRNYDLQTPDGKMILGGEEYLYVKEANATFQSRVDTGAAISSISAKNITEFERQGKKWLRFDVETNDRSITVEAPFVRMTQVRQTQNAELVDRPIIKLNVKLADYSVQTEFNLIDRSRMQYPLLIGRSLLTDICVVDVSRSYVQKRADDDGLIFLTRDNYNDAKKKGINPNAQYDERERSNKAGQIAVPVNTNINTGSNSERNLPSVSAQIDKKQNIGSVNLKAKPQETKQSSK